MRWALCFAGVHWLVHCYVERRHRNRTTIPARIRNKPRAIHKQEPLRSKAPIPGDGAGVHVGAGVGGLGKEVLSTGSAVVLAGTGVGDGELVAVTELVGEGVGVEEEVAVALPVLVDAVGLGDATGTSAPVPVGEEVAVSGGTAVSEGTPGDWVGAEVEEGSGGSDVGGVTAWPEGVGVGIVWFK
jgi:hypothetical protein